jgi:hypothetical protein
MSKTKSWYMDLLDSFDELYQVATKKEKKTLRELWENETETELVELLSKIKTREELKK